MEKNLNMSVLTLRDIASSLFRQKFIIMLTFIVITSVTIIGLKLQTPVYEARVKIFIKGISQTEGLTYQGIGAFQIHFTQMEIVKSEPVLKRAVTTLKLDERPVDYEKKYASTIKRFLIDYFSKKEIAKMNSLTPEKRLEVQTANAIRDLKKNIETELIERTDIFYIGVKDYDPDTAMLIANVVSRAYTIFDQQQQLSELALKYGNLHPTVQQLQDNIYRMDQNLSGAKLPDLEAIGAASVKIIEQATTDGFPLGKPKLLILIMSLFVSGFLGIALALFFDMIDQTFKSPDDLVTYANIPVLGSIPKRRFREKPFLKDSTGPTKYNVFYEDLADQIFIFLKTQNLKTILVSSPMQREINTTIVPNLGYIFSQLQHHKTLLVDCNLRNPLYQTLLGINPANGIANLIEGDGGLNTIQKIDTDLDVIATGNTTMNPIKLMDKFNINEVLKDIKNDYEIILLDGTNIKNFNDIVMLSPNVDGVVVVVNEGRDRKLVVKNAIVPMKLNNVKILGGVLNSRTFKIPEVIYRRI